MARIPESEVQRLKEEVSVQRLVESSGLVLAKQGKDLAVRCPFHADDTASLVVTPTKNLWHCFGCGAGGGPIDWVMRMQGVSFRHAVELLREGLPLHERFAAGAQGGDAGQPKVVKDGTVKKLAAPVTLDADENAAVLQVVDYYHATLKTSPEALAYLQSRGLNHPELIDHFRLGFANRTLGLRLPHKNRLAGAQLRTLLQRVGIYRESGHEHFNGSLVVPVFEVVDGVSVRVTEIYGRKLLDNLRAGTPKHLYLPGPHAGVWNEAALVSSAEVILCEALIDAMTFWCAGFRNVTASYGTQGFTDDHLEAFKRHGVQRVLIAYDRDEAGERAAKELAPRLQGAGMGVWRIQFPKGMDANEYALKVTPAAKSLGLLIRKAEWLGNGQAPARQAGEPMVITASVAIGPSQPDTALPVLPLVADLAAEPVAPVALPPELPLPAAAVPAAAVDTPAQVSEREVVLAFGEGSDARRWRVRGLPKNLSVGVLKVNVMVSNADGCFHVDTLDLYAARARSAFVQQAAAELGQNEGILKTDLGRVLLKLETLQDEAIREALTPKEVPVPSMGEAERADALALLQSSDLMGRIVADFEACGVVGESSNKLVGYLAAVSRLLERPLAVVIQSSSAAGKSSLMDAILAFVPTEARTQYSAMTGQSLFYMGATSLKHRILAIAEEEGASRASYAMKLLQSEGELTIASTGSDPQTGNLITQEYRVEGPTMLMMTTTAIDLDEELLNRCLVLTVDEDREQTRRIHTLQRQKRTLAGLERREAKTAILNTHRNAQRLLRSLAVVNPWADQLTFLDDRTRTRRDHEKYLTLIDVIALLHQHQRQVKTASVQGRTVEYIEVTLADIERANQLAHEVLGRSLDELPPQTRRLLGQIVVHVGARAQAQGGRVSDVRFTRGELRGATGASDTQLKVHLARLAELEYLLVHRVQRGQGFEYELLYDGDAHAASHLSGLIDVQALQINGYDMQRSGSEVQWSAPGRGVAGPVSAGGRTTETAATPALERLTVELSDQMEKPRMGGAAAQILSYPKATTSLAAVASA